MGEKSTQISDQGTGLRYASRDAYETDGSANARVVQLVDLATRHHSFDRSSPLRACTGSDSPVTNPVPAAVLSAALTTGDKSLLVATVHYTTTDPEDFVILTPLQIDDSDEAVGILEPKVFQGISLLSGLDGKNLVHEKGDILYYTDTDDYTLTLVQAWDMKGAETVGIHVTLSSSGISNARVYADVVSGHPDNFISGEMPEYSKWGART